ncbi:MAG: hypothetical protein M1358_08210, partial [Chloroflexi bacterium]|nr:hypothetical protein [Chloroflexota bacterium]
VEDIGTWQEVFVRTCSERVQKAIKRAVRTPEICLEHARAEMKAYEQYKNEPRIIQRAKVFETYLREKTIFIMDGELIVGNVNSKIRGSKIFGELYARFLDEELDDPEKDFTVRKYDRHIIQSEERKELREKIIPYFTVTPLQDLIYSLADEDVKEKAFMITASCKHIPNFADLMTQQDAGHMLANYEKVLWKGLNGLREEVESYRAHLDQPYMHFNVAKKRDFYDACLISLDAAIAYAQRYVDLAREMAAKENDPKRKGELERIAEVCERVPAKPARNWWEAVQSVWFVQLLMECEQVNYAQSFGRFDQYMYPFYKKSVIDDKVMTRDEALELLECFWVKTSEWTELYNYDTAQVQTGFPVSQNLITGGQTRSGEDAVNEVSWLCLEAEEQVGLIQPEIAVRLWEGTPHEFIKKAAEVVRLGRGKMKFYGDRMSILMEKKAYPDLTIEDWRDYAVIGCVEIAEPHISMQHSFSGLSNIAKVMELVLNNGKCAICDRQIGPMTGDPKTFESMAAVKEAFREQTFYWMKRLCRGVTVEMEGQAQMTQVPFSSSLLEGPLQKGLDLIQGGAWYTSYGLMVAGIADAADSLAVIEKLIYHDKKVSWDQLLEALKDDWKGHEDLRQLCLNGVPKYGNDDDYADSFAAWVMDTWYDSIDWANTQKELLPRYGGEFRGSTIIVNGPTGMGAQTGSLPSGRPYPHPLADTMSPSQGMDKQGSTAVIKSVGKMPAQRYAMGTSLNQRLSPQLLAVDRDIENFVAYLKACEELGVYHIQFNVITSKHLRKAIEDPEKYKDLMVRVASYCAYFTELDPMTQLDIINRSEQTTW